MSTEPFDYRREPEQVKAGIIGIRKMVSEKWPSSGTRIYDSSRKAGTSSGVNGDSVRRIVELDKPKRRELFGNLGGTA